MMIVLAYALGLLNGLILALIWLILAIILPYTPSKSLKLIQDTFKEKQKGEVLLPPDEATEAREKYIKQQHELGIDVRLEDL